MTSKCDERILKEIQLSFKLAESRKNKTSTGLALTNTWVPASHKPKVALNSSQITQKKPMEILKPSTKTALGTKVDKVAVNYLNNNQQVEIPVTDNKFIGKHPAQVLQKSRNKRLKLENGSKKSKQLKTGISVSSIIKNTKQNKNKKPDQKRVVKETQRLENKNVDDEDIGDEIGTQINGYLTDDSGESFNEGEFTGSSVDEYSLGSDDDFFRKPQVYKSKDIEIIPVQWENDVDTTDNLPWKMDIPEVEGDITKVLVFDREMPENGFNLLNGNESEEVVDEDEELEVTNDDSEKEPEQSTTIESTVDTTQNSSSQSANEFSEERQPEPELSIFENSFKTNNVLAVFKQEIALYGTIILTLLSGRVTINGFKARPNVPVTIYSPKGYNWVVVSPLSNKKAAKPKIDYNKLNESFSRAQLDNIVNNFDGERDAIVLLQRNSGAQRMLNTFVKHMSENVFPLLNATNRPHYASEYILNCLIQSSDARQALQVPSAWTKLPLQPSSRLLVAGGKGVGKSTLLRYLLNRHLEQFPRILFIDLDIGQPELFLPQTVSCTVIDAPLLGAGYFHNLQPDRAYVVGHVNIVMCADIYIRAVRRLLANCRANQSYIGIPWLINTMGYNKGFGQELMRLLVDCTQPTDLVQIESPKAINNFDKPLSRESLSQVVPIIYTADEFRISGDLSNYKLHMLNCAVPQLEPHERRWQMSAKDKRYSNLLARLSCALRGNATHLTECLPVQVDLDKLQILHLTGEHYTQEELLAGIEANLVYLCKGPRDGQPTECLGIGIVRAVDYESGKLYLLPAMPLERLSQVTCLVLGGDMYLPQGFFKDQGPGVTNNVPFVFIIDDTRFSKSIQQIYFRAPGFLGRPPTPIA